MSIKAKVYTFVNRIVTFIEDKSKHIIRYDIDNLLPQRIIRQVSESGTATACIDILNQYIFAEGLVNEELGKTKVNDTQTFNEVIAELTTYASLFHGIALHIQRDASGTPIKIKCLPFENIRVGDNGNYIYNPTYSLEIKFDISKDIEYLKYMGAEINNEQLIKLANSKNKEGKVKGEILYSFYKKPGQYTYPIPSFFSAISDIDADAENSKFELESTNNAFLAGGFLTVVGDINDKIEDEFGKTEMDYYNDTLESFTGNNKDRQGETGRNKLLLLSAKTKEEIPIYQPMNSDGVFNAIELSSKRVSEKVSRAFGVPPFLIGLGGNVGFATNIISDNITLFNNRVRPFQNLISSTLSKVFIGKDFTMTQNNPIKYIDPKLLDTLTEDELRALIGYKPKEIKNVIPSINN